MKNETEQIIKDKKLSKRKYIIASVLVFLCILAGLIYRVITWTPVDSESKKASDVVIRQIAAKQLNKDPIDLTDEDFTKITQIKIINKELSDIILLEKFINLQLLQLEGINYPTNKIPKWMSLLATLGLFNPKERLALDLSPLEKLTNLQTLKIWNANFYNIEPLVQLKNLHTLSLRSSYIQFKDIKPLENLIYLQSLRLSNTNVRDIKPLVNLENLESLVLDLTNVSDINVLSNLTNIKELYFYSTPVSNFNPILNLKKLRVLYLNNTHISNEQIVELKGAMSELEIIK